jgi:hypothetical protein
MCSNLRYARLESAWNVWMLTAIFFCFICFVDGSQENTNEEAPENNPAYTTVYVGNLSHEVIRNAWNFDNFLHIAD